MSIDYKFVPEQSVCPVHASGRGERAREGLRTRRITGWLTLGLVFSASSLMISCKPPAPPSSDTVLGHIHQNDPIPAPAKPLESKVMDVDFYIDGSASMRGFAVPESSKFRQLIRQMEISSTESQFHVKNYKFTSTVTDVTSARISELQNPDFYSGNDTPLAELIDRVASQPKRTAIVISDMVQSEKTADSQGLVRALTHLAAQGPQIKLLGYRSEFAGKYYPENHDHGAPRTIDMTLSGSGDGGRPFYLLVVTPNRQTMTMIDELLISRMPALREFDATGGAIRMGKVDLIPETKGKPSWSLYQETKATGERPQHVESAFRWSGASAGDETVTLPLKVEMSTDIPVRSVTRMEFETVQVPWSKAAGLGSPEIAQIGIDGEFSENGKSMRLMLNLPKPAAKTWNFYRIRLRPGEANMDVPGWIGEWDTSDDTTAVNGKKTFQLRLLAESMVKAVSEKTVCVEWLLKVGGGK